MIMTKNRLLLLITLVLGLPSLGLYAQSVISPELMRQYQQAGGSGAVSNEALERIRAAQARNTGMDKVQKGIFDTDTLKDTTALDSAALADSLAQEEPFTVKTKKGFVKYSVYEVMFKGVDILPDDVLPYLEIYGYDAFSMSDDRRVRSPTGATEVRPGDMGNVPLNYPIKIGDEVKVHLWGRINQEYLLTVGRDGMINIPHNVGPVSVAGLPFESMQRTITDKLKNIEGVNVSLSMGELRPIGIYVVGEVKKPGFHTVSPLTNITNALFTADGITKRGSLRQVQLRRNGKLVSEVDYYDFLMSGNDKSGLRLQSGDVIVVPIVTQMVAVVGNVRRSALYELKKPAKLKEVLDLAGGVSPAAWTNRIQVERFDKNERLIVLDVDAAELDKVDFMVKDGDVVKVFPVLTKDDNVVHLSGNVLRPGKYEYREGMRITDVIPNPDALLPESYFEYAVVMRRTLPSFLEKVVTFNLGNAFKDPGSDDNIVLEPYDKIIVYNMAFFDPDRTVSVDGAVTVPGTQKLLENMTIRDLILQAGGLKDEASVDRGELYRRRVDGESVSTQKIAFNIIDAMMSNPEHNRMLQRGDRVFIRSKKDWEPERRVRLRGQVVYPGIYLIFEGETLGDLLKRAGGFRPDAYLPAAVFTREAVKSIERNRMKSYASELEMNMVRLSIEMTSQGQSVGSLLDQQMRLKDMFDSTTVLGRVTIDMTDEEEYKSFIVEDGDELFVPRNLNTISVLGDVYNPSTFRLEARRPTVSYYLSMAGGTLSSADKKNMYIIRANGRVVSNSAKSISGVELQPGDVLIVPARIRYPNRFKIFLDSADATLKVASLLTTIVTLMIVINQNK
jgi:protein involved in polysaccharide export with SLBB domain